MVRQVLVLAIVAQASPALAGIWTEDFTGSNGSTPTGWTISTSNGSMDIQSNTLYMNSQGSGYAWGYPDKSSFPVLDDWDQTLPYRVEFDFKIPNTNNHWFFVYVDSRVHTVIDYGDDFKYRAGTSSSASNVLIMELNTDQWYSMQYDVFPAAGYFDIYVDNVLQTAGAGFLSQNRDPFHIGDRPRGNNEDYDHGSAYWDNFQLTTNVPEPSTLLVWTGLSVIGLVTLRRRRAAQAATG